MINKKRNKLIICLCLLGFILLIPSLSNFNFTNFNSDTTLETSTNYLFNGVNYPFNLDDYYDDANLYKTFTGAEFQTEWFNDTELAWSGTYDNDTVTPVNNTEIQYGSPSGHYPATYTFDDQPIETKDTDIYYIDSMSTGAAGDIEIISEYMGHNTVINFTSANARSVIHNFDENQDAGVIEFYDKEFVHRNYWMLSYDGGGSYAILILPYVLSARFYYWNGAANVYITHTYTTDFPHFKVEFDCNTDTYSAWCEGVLVIDDLPFYNGIDADYIYRIVHYNSAAFGFYLDAVGVSWDPEYTIGDNLYPDNINMIEGSYDYSDNMRVNDDLSTNFTSTHTDGYIYETPVQWDNFTFTEGSGDTIDDIEFIDGDYSVIDSSEAIPVPEEFIDHIDYTFGSGAGTLSDTETDDGNFYTINPTAEWFGSPTFLWVYDIDIKFIIDPVYTGRDFLFSTDIQTTGGYDIQLSYNGGAIESSTDIDFNDTPLTDVTWIRLYGHRWDDTFSSKIYFWKLVEDIAPVSAELDVQIDMEITDPYLNSIEYFKFSHKTNVSVDIDLDIWNWDTTAWYEIESVDNSANFDDDSFALGSGSDYVNTSFGVRIRFQATNANDFELLIDRFRLDYLNDPSDLEMTITFSFARYNEDFLAMNVTCWQMTNITQLMNFSIWNFDTSDYIQISSSSETSFTKKNYNTASPSDFISPTGEVKLHWIGTNTTSNFNFSIDYLFVQIYYKLDLEHLKAFDTNGIYRYRWEITGSIHYTQWVTFEVVDPASNFHAISESDYTTRWILQDNELTAVEDFHDDINTDYWNLIEASTSSLSFTVYPTDDTGVNSIYPDTVYGTGVNMDILSNLGQTVHTLIKYEIPYLTANFTTNSTIYSYLANIDDPIFNIYETIDFDENTATWNNQPSTENYIKTVSGGLTSGWDTIDIGKPFDYYKFVSKAYSPKHWVTLSSKDWDIRKLQLSHYLTKNYFGSGYMYMQTNETESIGLQSQDYGTHKTLFSGDYFKVDFQTSSDSQIDLILLKDGVINKTLTLSSSGNTNFNRHTVQISVSEELEFDQLKISGTLEDTDNVKVYDIKTYKYTLAGDSADFVVGSRGTESVYLTPDIYNLKISDYSSGHVYVDENVTIGSTDLYYVYTPIERLECRLILFSLAEEYLQFEDYHVNISRSLGGVYGDFWLVDTLFYADVGTNVYIDVYDRFDALIYSDFELVKPYIDLYIEIYSLKIRNEATEIVDYTLQNTDTGSSKTGILFSDEIVEYYVKSGNYNLDYTNYEDMYPREYIFELTTHKTISINSTYHTVYIGLFTYDGLGLDRDWVRLYINDERKDFGFNVIDSETMELIVLDYFNNTLANETIDASAYSEYNLYAEVYSLYLLNQFTYNDLIMNITQVGSGTYMNQLIPASSALLYRFIPDLNYTISATYVNGTIYNIRTINLTLNSQTESFGISTQPTEYPKDVYFGVYTTTGLGINHDLLRFYIDNIRTDFGFNRIEDMIITITVKDYFNTTLFNQMINTSGIYEYNILITLYSLKIKNEARLPTNYTLSYGLLETTGFILPEEIIEYQLSSNNYVFDYTNNEDDSLGTININLNQNRVYILNTTYYNIYFSLFDLNLHALDLSQYEFRLNGTIYDFGFIEDLITNDYAIIVVDRFSTFLFDSIITLRGLNEYRINITLFELQISHLARENGNLTLSETTGHSSLDFNMAPNTIKSFILGSSTYNVTWLNNENGITTTYNINLINDYILTLKSSYYNIYFSLFDLNLHTIDSSQYTFRLNGTIQDFGLISDLQTDDYTITVVDKFGISLFNSIITLRDLNEYRINITLFELQIRHLATENSNMRLYETTIHNSFNFSMAPDTIKSLILGSSTYNITWINGENGVSTLYNINLNIDYILTLNSSYYDVYIGLLDQGGVRLDNSLFSLYINNSRKDFGFIVLETDSVLIVVQDYLNVTVFNQVVSLRNYNEYDIIITIFELQIRHLGFENSNITLYETITHNYLIFSMAPDTIRSFMLANSTYNCTWINGENSVSTFYNIILDENYILLLDTTYYSVYIGLYNFYGVVNREEVKFYINGTRADFGFNTIRTEYAHLTVLDYFNSTLYNRIVRLEGLTEYSIFIKAHTLVVNNLYNNKTITIKISRGTITIERLIEAQGWTEFKLFPNIEYEIKSFINGSKDEEKVVDLDEEYKTVDFGFYEAYIPTDVEPITNTFITYLIVIIFLVGISFAAFKLYYTAKERKTEVPAELVNLTVQPHRKKRDGVVDDRL